MLTKAKFKPIAVMACMLLVILSIFCIGNTEANAATSGYCGNNLRWSYDTETGVLTITGTGSMSDYTSSDNTPWRSLLIKKVVISDGVTSIGNCAFWNCSEMSEVTFGNSIKKIGSRAFQNCQALRKLSTSENLEQIGDFAFIACKNLTSITVGAKVTKIGSEVFNQCNKLIEVINKSNLNIVKGASTYGGIAAFAKTVHSEESKIVNVDDYLFYKDGKINYLVGYEGDDAELILPESYEGGTYQLGEGALWYNYDIKSVIISNGVTRIGKEAFMCSDNVEKFVIPESVTAIDQNAFRTIQVNVAIEMILEDPYGWKAGSTAISAADLSNPETASDYLRYDYRTSYWTRHAHTYEESGEQPTCTENGAITYTCNCGRVYSEELTAPGHSYDSSVTAPTCTEGGYTTYTCSVCEYSYVGDETEANGHIYESAVTAPTCTEGGYTTFTCSVCEDNYVSDETEATGHNYVDGLCSVCGESDPNVSTGGDTTDNGTAEEAPEPDESEGGCGGSETGAGMYLSYFMTVLIPSAFFFLSKRLFF